MTKFKKLTLLFSIMVASSMLMSTAQAKKDDDPKPAPPHWIKITNPSIAGFAVGTNSVQYGPVAAQTV